MRLPILRLPYVAFQNVYPHLDCIDLIMLSQCSKTLRNCILANERLRNDNTIDIEMSTTEMIVRMASGGRKGFEWSLHTKKDDLALLLKKFVDLNIEGVHWKLCPLGSGLRMLSTYNEDHLIFWVTFLKNLFNCKITNFNCQASRDFDFQKLFVESDVLRKVEEFYMEDFAVSNWEMEFLLDNLEVKDFRCHAFLQNTFHYEKPISFNHFTIGDLGGSDNFDNLLSCIANCQFVHLRDTRKGDAEINTFLKQWLESDNVNLEKIVFDQRDRTQYRPFNLSNVTQGLPVFPGSKKNPDASRHYFNQDLIESGLDIRRKDGVLATISYGSYANRSITFTVWNQPYPFLIE